ncbi:MAG: hypothetical protein EBR01_00505 [Proteobacteria bacterium]|jgi:hypothetical protein|nr:hypothetical protein [Pseudomonadota bacterium]
MYKTVLKYFFIVCAVLMIGQIDIDRRALGDYFSSGVKDAGEWALDRLAENPLIAKISRPHGLENWFPLGQMNKKENPLHGQRASVGFSELNSVEEIDEEEADIDADDFFESEFLDDAEKEASSSEENAVMAILP